MLAMYSGRQRRSARFIILARRCVQKATDLGTYPGPPCTSGIREFLVRGAGGARQNVRRRLGKTSRSVQSRYYRIEGIVFKSREIHYSKR